VNTVMDFNVVQKVGYAFTGRTVLRRTARCGVSTLLQKFVALYFRKCNTWIFHNQEEGPTESVTNIINMLQSFETSQLPEEEYIT